jgi:hypothetical protein
MPTLTELRRQVRHRLMALAKLERPEPVLCGHCVLLDARGLRGAAAEAWCVARVNTEFIGYPRRRRATRVRRIR